MPEKGWWRRLKCFIGLHSWATRDYSTARKVQVCRYCARGRVI